MATAIFMAGLIIAEAIDPTIVPTGDDAEALGWFFLGFLFYDLMRLFR